MINFFIFLIILLAGIAISNSFKTKIGANDIKILKRLWFYHLFFGIFYWSYITLGGGGDADNYWLTASQINFEQAVQAFFRAGPGTYGLHLLNFGIVKPLGLSFFALSMVYTLIGHIGIVYFYIFFKNNIPYNTKIGSYYLFPLLFFLPNLHFWSSGVGKDTLLFLSIALFFYGMQNPLKNLGKLALALGLSYLIRPHITIFLITSFGLAFVLDGKLKSYQKILFFGLCLAGFFALFDNIMAYLKLESLDAESVSEFTDTRVSNLSRSSTGSSVDISSYPFPLKIFTFLYRPLFFDINGVMAIVASFENLLLLIISWKFLKLNPIKMFKNGNYLVKGLFIFLVIGAVSFSLILSNLGIMLRQKNMFIPALLFICLWGFSYQKEKQLTKAKLS